MAIEAYRHAVADNYVKELIDFRRKASIDEASRIEEARRDAEVNKAIEMARKMLSKGMDIKTISEITGLSEDKIK